MQHLSPLQINLIRVCSLAEAQVVCSHTRLRRAVLDGESLMGVQCLGIKVPTRCLLPGEVGRQQRKGENWSTEDATELDKHGT